MKKFKPVSEIANEKRKKHFPAKISKNITCEIASYDEIRQLTKKNFDRVFTGGFQSQVRIPPNSKNSNQLGSTYKEYEKIHSEGFLFKDNGKAIGWSMGEMEDFETFYMRNTGILPSHQSKGIYTKFLKIFLKYMADIGYQRVSSHHDQHNAAIFSCKLKQGFMIVGTEDHDRWGSLVKMVKFIDPKREKKFKTIF